MGVCVCVLVRVPSCTQAKLRLEMEMERQRQSHSKEIESKDEEVDEIRHSCSKKVGVARSRSQIRRKVLRTHAAAQPRRAFMVCAQGLDVPVC